MYSSYASFKYEMFAFDLSNIVLYNTSGYSNLFLDSISCFNNIFLFMFLCEEMDSMVIEHCFTKIQAQRRKNASLCAKI